MNCEETRYSTFDRELLACVSTIQHFRLLLEGWRFFILSDHKLLSYALHRVSNPWSAHQQRHLAYVAEYTSEIRHMPGADNLVADSLSRPAASGSGATTCGCSSGAARLNRTTQLGGSGSQPDHMLRNVLSSSSLQLQQITIQAAEVWCDLSTGSIWPLIPGGHRSAVFEHVHHLFHAGMQATTR